MRPATLALLSGWGFGSAVMQPLQDALSGMLPGAVVILPLPKLLDPDAWLDDLMDAMPEGRLWLAGWSLGGQLAVLLAQRLGARCAGLVTIASNPSFRVREDWLCAMERRRFESFVDECRADVRETLWRFCQLCAAGAPQPRSMVRQLRCSVSAASSAVLLAGLELLHSMDTRQALASLSIPQRHVFAGEDALVPASVAGEMAVVCRNAQVELIAGACHALPMQEPQKVADGIAELIRENDYGAV